LAGKNNYNGFVKVAARMQLWKLR